jgi:HlyD family secretion protein
MKISARTFLIIWLVLAAFLGGQYAYDFWLRSELPPGLIQVAGRIKGDAIPLPAGLPGKIVSLDVKAGDFVEQGQVVGELDGSSIQAELDDALRERDNLLASRELLQSEREIMRQDVPISIQIAKAALHKADAKLEQSQAVEEQRRTELDRVKGGKGKSGNDPEVVEKAKLALVRARTRRQTDEAEVARQAEAVKLAELGFQKIEAANEQLSVLQHQIDEMDRNIATTRDSLGDPSIKAPVEGVITKRLLGVGDLAEQGQAVAEMADPNRLFLKVWVAPDQVSRLAVGMPARIWLELHPETMLTAKIGFIPETPDMVVFPQGVLASSAEAGRNDTSPAPEAGKDENATLAANASSGSGEPRPMYGIRLYLDDNPGNLAVPGQTGVAVIRYNEDVSWRKPRKPFKK